MRITPVVIDSRPAFVPGDSAGSLLQMPLGRRTVLAHVFERMSRVTGHAPGVLASFSCGPEYETAMRQAEPGIAWIVDEAGFLDKLPGFEASDFLLLINPRRFPADGFDLTSFCSNLERDPRTAQHLVAVESTAIGTKECLQVAADGGVRRVQRYYPSVTWPFTSGVAATLLPVAATLMGEDLPFASLLALRAALALRGTPSRDRALDRGTYDLSDERGLLGLNEHYILNELGVRSADRSAAAARRTVDSGARILGPVIVQADAVVDRTATVIGPAVIGSGAVIGPGAVVAQCVVAAGALIEPDAERRHRVLVGRVSSRSPEPRLDSVPLPFSVPEAGYMPSTALQEDTPPPSRYARFKPVAESVLAFLLLVLLSPLLALLALLIKLDSKGPVLYGDKREGKGGRPFRCWKFRSMSEGSHALQTTLAARNQMDGPQFKIENDPRVTRAGRFLRPTSLDELPQLINVLCGEMSFVGPRPSPFRENQMCIPWREARLSVRPGVSGLWQVCRHDRMQGDFHQWIYYDLRYVRQMSLLVDVKIAIATVLTGGGKGHVPISWIIPAPKTAAQGERRGWLWPARLMLARVGGNNPSPGGKQRDA